MTVIKKGKLIKIIIIVYFLTLAAFTLGLFIYLIADAVILFLKDPANSGSFITDWLNGIFIISLAFIVLSIVAYQINKKVLARLGTGIRSGKDPDEK